MKWGRILMQFFLSLAIFLFLNTLVLSDSGKESVDNNKREMPPVSLNILSFLHSLGICHLEHERHNILFRSTTFSPSTIAPTNPGICAPEATLSTQSMFWHIDGLEGKDCGKEFKFVMDYTVKIKSNKTGSTVSQTSGAANVSCVNYREIRGRKGDEDNWWRGLYISGPVISAAWNGETLTGGYVPSGDYRAEIKAKLLRIKIEKEHKHKIKDNDESEVHYKRDKDIKVIATGFTTTNSVYVDVAPPVISFDTPSNNELLCSSSTLVTGTVNSGLPVNVYVNGQIASVYNNTFVVPYLPISEGSNIITAFASDACGLNAMQYIYTTAQLQPPSGAVTYPSDGSYISTSTVNISGTYYESSFPAVSINGISCTVGYGTFTCPNNPANEGLNTYNVSLTNQCAESSNIILHVTRNDIAPQLQILYPNSAYINKNTIPVYGTVTSSIPVTVSVNGVAANVQGNVFTVSSLLLTEGTNQIQVNATDAAGNASSAETKIIVDTEAPLLWVNFPSTNFAISTYEVNIPVVVSDALNVNINVNGNIITDTISGLHIFKNVALIDGENNIVISAQDLAGNVTSTSLNITVNPHANKSVIHGVVRANTGAGISNVTMILKDTGLTTTTGDSGAYTFTEVTPGQYVIIADGETYSSSYLKGYTTVLVTEGNNATASNIYLTPLNTQNGVYVSDNQDAVITFSYLPGLSITIPAGNAIFPDGGKSGWIYAQQLSPSTLPVPLPPGYIGVTYIDLEPSGLSFTQPVNFTLPNLDELPSKTIVHIYTSDLETGMYEYIGDGSVSNDGTQIIPLPGVKLSHFSVIFTTTYSTQVHATIDFVTSDGITHRCPGASSDYYMCQHQVKGCAGQDMANAFVCNPNQDIPPFWLPWYWEIPIGWCAVSCHKPEQWSTLCATETIAFPDNQTGIPTPVHCSNCVTFSLSSPPPNPNFTMHVPIRTEVRGRVVDENYTPIQGARVVISGNFKTLDCSGPQTFPALYTGVDGRFDEMHVLGDPNIRVEYGSYSHSYSFSAGPDGGYTDVGDIVLPIILNPVSGTTFTVTGTFRWEDGSPRINADIELFDPLTDAIIADSQTDSNGNFAFVDINSALFEGTYFGLVHDDFWFCRLSNPSIHLGIIPASGTVDGSFSEPQPGLHIVPLSPVINGFTNVTSPVVINSMVTGTPGLGCGGFFTGTDTIENSVGETNVYSYSERGRLTAPTVVDEPPGPIHISYQAIAEGIGQDQYDWYGYVLTPPTVSGTPLTISGTVSMPDGTPLSGARIKLFNDITGMNVGNFITYTNADGGYTITNVPTGLLSSNGSIGIDAYTIVNNLAFSGHTVVQVSQGSSQVTANINIPQFNDLSLYPLTGSVVQSPFFVVIRYAFSGEYPTDVGLRNLVLNNMDTQGNPTGISVNLHSDFMNEDVQLMPVAFIPGVAGVDIISDYFGIEYSTIFTVTAALPSTPPPPSIAVSFTTPTANIYTNQSLVYVGGSFSGDVSSIMLAVNGTTQGYAYIDSSNQTFTGTVDLSQQGYTQILALATSSLGAYAQTTTSVYYDTSPPSISIGLPTQGSIVTASTIMISGFVTDTVTPANDITVWTPNSLAPCVNLSGNFACLNVMLFDGENNVVISATDLAGNTSTTTVNVISATQPPLITISSPSNGDRFASSAISVNGIASDNYGLPLSITVNGINASVSGNNFFATGIALSSITNTIEAIAIDSVGLSSITTVSVSHQAAPTMSITWNYPLEGETVSTTAPLAEVSYTDTTYGINFTSLTLTIDGILISSDNLYSFEQYEDRADWFLQNLRTGTHTLVASVLNGQGNISQTTTTFSVNPAIVISRLVTYHLYALSTYALSTSGASVGDTVIITGYGLDAVTNVCLTGSNNGTSSCGLSTILKGGGIGAINLRFLKDPYFNTEIAITVPPGAVTGPLIAGNMSEVSNAAILQIIPVIQHLSNGVVSPGQALSIYGTGFSLSPDDDIVELNGVNCPVLEVANGMIKALIPSNAVSGDLRVIVNGAQSRPVGLIVIDPSKHQITGIANSTNPITPGQTAIGYFSSSTQKDIYTFNAQQGSFISINTASIDNYGNSMGNGGVQLLIKVFAPDGEEIASIDQPSTSDDTASIDNLYLNQTGTYSVVISPSLNSPNQTGAYQCSITIPHGVYIQDVNPGIGITGNTVVLTGRDFTSSPYIYFTSSTGSQLSYTSDSMTVGTSSIIFTMPSFTDTVVYICTANNQNDLPYTYADVVSDVTVVHSAQPVPMYRENHQYWFSYPSLIPPLEKGAGGFVTGSTEAYLNPATDGQLFTIPVTSAGTSITFTVYGVDEQGNTITEQTASPVMKLYTSSGFAMSTATSGTLSMQFAVPGVYQLAVMPVSGTSNLIKLDMNAGYTSMSEPFRMTVVSSELQLGLYGSTNQQPMTVLVTDQMQRPVSGVNVYFADNNKTFSAWTGSDGTASAPAGTFTYDAPYGSVKFITAYIVDPTGAIMPGLVSTFKMYTYILQGVTTNSSHIPYSITPIDPTIVQGTVGSTLSSNPLNVVVTDESGTVVSGTGVEFDVCIGDATFGNGQKSMVTFTNQYGIASAIVTLGRFTNDYPAQMQINANDPYPTQVGVNSICVSALSANNVRLNDAFHVLALPGPPVYLLPDINTQSFQTDLPNHPLFPEAYYVLDMYNNPVANSSVEFSVLDATPTTPGPNFINAKLYDDTPISATKFIKPCSEGGAPSYRDSMCNNLRSDFITASRNDGIVAAIMYLGNTAGVTYNGRATLVSGIMVATQDFHGIAAISGTGSSGIYDIECWELVLNNYGIVNMWLPYPYKCTMLQTAADTTAGQNVYNTGPDAQGTYQAQIMRGGGKLARSLNSSPDSAITLAPDGSGNVQFYLKLGPSVPPNGCKGYNLKICPNEVKVSGIGAQSGAISRGDLYSFGRDVEVFYPQASTGPQIINYSNSQGSYSIIVPTTIAAYVRSYVLGSIDISRVKFTFGLNITYPGLPHPSFGYDPNIGCDLLVRDVMPGMGQEMRKG